MLNPDPTLAVHAPPLPLLAAQADLQYHGVPAGGIFNPPAATGMPFWSLNPYVGCAFGCAYCYARDTHRWRLERAGADGARVAESMPPWLAFERRILVKEDAAAQVRAAFRSNRSPSAGDSLVIGTATDPYQPAERHLCITRSVLEAMGDARGIRMVIITKSPLVTRDVDLLARLTVRNRLSVHISLITLDRELARRIEPRAPTPESRLRAVRRLSDAGINVGVNCMPVLPGITDQPAALAELVARVAEAGATHVAACPLRLRSTARRRYLPLVREAFPQLAGRYSATYHKQTQINDRYREGLSRFMKKLCARHGLGTRAYRDDGTEIQESALESTDERADAEPLGHDAERAASGSVRAEQLVLALTDASGAMDGDR